MKAVKILFIILTLCLGIITQTKADGGEAVSGSVAVTSVSGISGMVKDALTGNGIDSADIVITTSTGLTYQTTSYPTGAYFYSMMPSGSFTISITASGYQPVNQLVQAGQGCVFNVFSLVSSDTNYLQLTDQLRIYYENKIINQTGYYTLSGNVNVNGILYFQGEVKVDMRPDLYLHEVSGSEGYFLDDIQGSSVNLLSSSIPYKFYAEDDQLIAKEYMYLAEIPIDMGGFPLTLAGIQIGPTGDSVYLKVIPKLPFPFDKIINIYLEMNDLSVPDIISQISLSVIYSKVNGKGYAGSIEDLEKDFILFKLEGVHVEFDSSLELFGAGFTLSIPGGEEEKSIGSEPIDSLNANLPVIIQDSLGNILTQTNFNNILSNFKAFGLKFLKFGVDVEFIHGAINKLILTLGTKIPIDQTGLFITEIKGGVDNMINENDWRILASVDVETGIDIPPLGSPVKLDDFGVNIHPFSYLKGSGTFEIFDNPVSDGYIEYDSYKKSLSGEGNLDLDDILVGKLFLNLRGGGNLNGGGTLTLKTPSDIPWYLRLIPENKVIAAVETGYSLDKFEVQLPFIPTVPPIPVPIAVKLQFGNPNFPFFHYYLGFNLKDIFLIWKGTKSGKTSIQFQVPENCPKLMVVAGDTLDNQPVDFQLIAPGGRLYDSTWVNYYQFAETHQTMMVIDQPLPGEWTFICSDTANLKMVPMFQNQQPTGLIAQPLKNGSKSNNITLDFTDYSDTLNVKVFYDTDREHFDGSFIQEFQVVNNAHLAFDWQNQDITDGEYFIYCMIDDGKNAPVMQYAPGSIQVQHTGFTEVPQNVVITQPGDSVRIQWDVNAGSDIRFTTVYFKNLSTGRNDEVMVSDTNVAFLKGLKIGQAYEVWCSFVGQQGNTGPASIAQNLTFHGPAGVNNPPYFTNDPHVYWKVIADEASGFTLTAGDADNDALSFSLPQDTLGITVNGNQLEWTPTGDQRGAYNLMVVVSDGTTTDTTHIQVIVYAQEQAGVDVSFSSVNLYENDNKFVRIRNYRSTANSIWVTVTNVNSGSQIDVDCRKVDEFEYIGKFELSFVNKSAIPVANGDSLRLTYEYNGQTYTAMAMYDSLAQPSDKTPPAGIYDLSVISLENNQVKLKWTAPGNDGTSGRAYKYDIRYSYTSITSDADYFVANRILQYPYPSLSGNRDSLVLSLDTLPGIEQHSSIWFTVKAEDENQNRSVLGNSPSLDYRLAPNDLKATPEQVYHVNLTWQGRKAAGFQHYNIYRKAGAEPFTMITDTVTMGAFTDNLYDAPDAGYQYAVQAVYTQGSSDSVFSDIVDIQRFINLMILCQLEDTTIYDSITFTMQGQDTVYSMSFNRTTNLTGLVMLPAVYFGDYVINISRSGYQSIHDTISVTPGNPSWSFTLLSLTKPRLFSGRVHYDNNASTPLGNIKVYLKNLSNTILDSTMTISTGDFSFSAIPGDYRIGFKCTKPSGGINSIDALLILKHFVGIDTLKGIKLTAADVDGSGNINASDALITMRRFVGLVSTFSVGDWIFENPLIVLSPDENNVLIFKGLCTGDVNGSYTP